MQPALWEVVSMIAAPTPTSDKPPIVDIVSYWPTAIVSRDMRQ